MQVIEAGDFLKDKARLPAPIQEALHVQIIRLRADLRDPRLHVKRLTDPRRIFSFRITSAYRALFFFHGDDTIIVYAVGHRKEIYRQV